MMRNGIVIATTSETVANIVRGLLIIADKSDDVVKEDFGWSENEKDLRRMVKLSAPRLVFVEHCFDTVDTKGVINRLCDRYDDQHVVAFSVGNCTPMAAARLVNWGAESYIDLHGERDEFDYEADLILHGSTYVPPVVKEMTSDKRCQPTDEKGLTTQQERVFWYHIACERKKDIAEKMCLSLSTITTHQHHIDRICGGKRLIDYIQYGFQQGLPMEERLEEMNYGREDMNDDGEN
jgi:DNA-binding NarL/FixJ family response regulator